MTHPPEMARARFGELRSLIASRQFGHALTLVTETPEPQRQALRDHLVAANKRHFKDKPITLHPCGALSCEGEELEATFIDGSPVLYIFTRLDEEGVPIKVSGREPGVPLPAFVKSKVGPIDPSDQKDANSHALARWAHMLTRAPLVPTTAEEAAGLIVATLLGRSSVSFKNIVYLDAERALGHIGHRAPYVSLEGYNDWADAWSFQADHVTFETPPALGAFYLQPVLGGFDACVFGD